MCILEAVDEKQSRAVTAFATTTHSSWFSQILKVDASCFSEQNFKLVGFQQSTHDFWPINSPEAPCHVNVGLAGH